MSLLQTSYVNVSLAGAFQPKPEFGVYSNDPSFLLNVSVSQAVQGSTTLTEMFDGGAVETSVPVAPASKPVAAGTLSFVDLQQEVAELFARLCTGGGLRRAG